MVRGFLLLIALALLGTLIHYATRLRAFTIQDIEVTGGVTISHDAIKDEVTHELQGSYWGLIPRTFVLTYPHDAITQGLLSHARLHDPRVERDGLTRLQVSFDEYAPYAILCGRDESKPCFLIDRSGFAFEEAGTLTGGALVRYVEEGQAEITRGNAISADQLGAEARFIENTERELGFRIGSVTYTEDGDIRFGINGGGAFLVNAARDLDESFENIHTVLQVDAYKDLRPGDFQYIDARFPPKIFVNDTPPDTALPTDESATGTRGAL